MGIRITEPRMDHAEGISHLTLELGYSEDVKNTREWLGHMLASEYHHLRIALDENEIVLGWIVVEKRVSLEAGFKAEITGLVVSEKCRRSGVGRYLVDAASSWAISRGLSKLVVRSNIKREESHKFYTSIGFRLTKTTHVYDIRLNQSA